MADSADIKALIRDQLPSVLAEDASIRDFVLRTVSDYYSPKRDIDQKFEEFKQRVDRILDELQRNREEQAHKWEENNHKWEEQYQQNRETLEEIKKMNRKHDSTIGALGSRWGLFSEASFRNGLAAILEDSFGVEVLNINDYDSDGIVFGRPDQVEIDVIIKNGLVIVCEIKSSMSKADMYIFSRKVEFYQQKYQRSVNRKIVISPMVDPTALPVAESLGIEVYSYAEDLSINA
jgi:hypothetical protein